MKKIFSLLFLFVLVVLGFGCKKNSDIEKVKKNGTMNIGITIYDPMDYFDEDGETIIGFDADLANEFCESLGIRARFTLINWDSKEMELNGGYIDLIWNGMTATDELGEKIAFSTFYATNFQCAVVKKGEESRYNSIDDLKGKQVAVERGSAGDSAVSGILTPNKVNSQLDALNEVKAGTSNVAVIDYTMAYSLVGKNDYSDLVIIDSTKISFEKELFAIGARKNSDIIAELNKFLKKKYDDGSLKELAIKYGVALNEEAFK